MFYFKTLKQLLDHFSDEQLCWDFLEEKLWKGTPVCPFCCSKKVYRLSDKRTFKCGNKKTCDRKFNVLKKTLFEGTKIPLQTWFSAIYFATQSKGVSSVQLSKHLGIQQRTAWFLLHRINTMILPYTKVELKGAIQIDETYLKGRNKNRSKKDRRAIYIGEKVEKQSIVLGFRDEHNAILKVVPNTYTETLHAEILKTVTDRNSLIITDGLHSYHGLYNYFPFRSTVNHSEQEYKNPAGYHTNAIESTFSLFKRTIYGTHHWVSEKHCQKYCDIFTHRFNMRKLESFQKLDITLSQLRGRLKYNDLIAPIKKTS